MVNRASLKKEAREIMRISRPSAFWVSLVVTGISFAATLPYLIMTANNPEETNITVFFWDILSNLLSWVLSAGLLKFLLALHRGLSASFQNVWDSFGIAGKIIWLQIRIAVQVTLWSMLFFFPGIIASYRYRFALYILLDNPDLSAGEALKRSCQKTNGWKMEMFWLELSFLGLALLLISVPAGIAAVIGALAIEIIGQAGLIVVVLVVLVVPVAWLQAYMSLAQIGLYRAAVPDSPAEQRELPEDDTPWEF